MIEGADGQYYLQAGAVLLGGTKIFVLLFQVISFHSFIHPVLPCFVDVHAGWWRLEDKIGLPLDAIHITGNTPHCTFLPFASTPTYLPHARMHARTFSSHSYLYTTRG